MPENEVCPTKSLEGKRCEGSRPFYGALSYYTVYIAEYMTVKSASVVNGFQTNAFKHL
jgi:hypothetical protein